MLLSLPGLLRGAEESTGPDQPEAIYDLVIYGNSSGAVIAAISAKCEGRSVILVNPTSFPGGMSASGETHHGSGVEWPFIVLAGKNSKLNTAGKYIRLPGYGEEGHKTLAIGIPAFSTPMATRFHITGIWIWLWRRTLSKQSGAIKQFLG